MAGARWSARWRRGRMSEVRPRDLRVMAAGSALHLTPRDTVRPTAPQAVAVALVEASEEGLAVVPQGGGVFMGLGPPPARPFRLLDTRALSRVLEYSPGDMTATVEAGIALSDFQAVLAAQGQQVGLEAPFPHRATVGGILAVAATGPQRLALGLPRDQVIGIRVAQPDGALTKAGGRVVKNVTGYDMAKLYVGSLGTLAVIVEATFRLNPIPAARRTLFVDCPSLAAGVDCTLAVQRARLQPTACELLDGATQARIPGDAPFHRRGWLLALAFAGNAAAVDRQLAETAGVAGATGFATAAAGEAEAAGFWEGVRDRGRVFGEPALILRAQGLPTAIARIGAALSSAAVAREPGAAISLRPLAGAAHAVWPAAALRQAGDVRWPAAVAAVRSAVHAAGGTLVVEEAPWSLGATLDVWGPPPEAFPIMQRMKAQFDPQNVLNPGRFVGRL